MRNLEVTLNEILAEVIAYNEKPTKACSKRVRTKLGSLKNEITGIRSKLVEADKQGYK